MEFVRYKAIGGKFSPELLVLILYNLFHLSCIQEECPERVSDHSKHLSEDLTVLSQKTQLLTKPPESQTGSFVQPAKRWSTWIPQA